VSPAGRPNGAGGLRRPTASGARVPPPGPHGGDGAAIAAALGWRPADVLDLSATINPLAPDPRGALRRALDSLGRYPDPTRARDALAERLEVRPDCLLLTNGGAEAIALVARVLGRARIEEPEFSLWRRHLEAVDPAGPRVRSNPHSPTGRLAGSEERAAVWDEAFYPLTTGNWTRGDTARHGSLVVGSLTKLLGLPGLRIGYVMTPDPATCARLAGLQPAWAVNGLVAAALPELLEPIDLPTTARGLAELQGKLIGALVERRLVVRAGEAPWVLVEAVPGLRERLAERGVVVRDCGSFGLPANVRIAVPDDAGRDRLMAALDSALESAVDDCGSLEGGLTERAGRNECVGGVGPGGVGPGGVGADAERGQSTAGRIGIREIGEGEIGEGEIGEVS